MWFEASMCFVKELSAWRGVARRHSSSAQVQIRADYFVLQARDRVPPDYILWFPLGPSCQSISQTLHRQQRSMPFMYCPPDIWKQTTAKFNQLMDLIDLQALDHLDKHFFPQL